MIGRPLLMVAVVATVGLVSGQVWAQTCVPDCREGYECKEGQCIPQRNACFPDCRAGFECKNARCVAVEASCTPDCRRGYVCRAGSCEAVARRLVDRAEPAASKPKAPPAPPRYQINVNYSQAGLFYAPELPAEPVDGITLAGRDIAAGVELLLREGKRSSNAWFSFGLGLGLVYAHDQVEYSSTTGDIAGLQLKLQQVFKIPLSEPAWDQHLDRRVSLDLGFGGYFISTEKSDLGAIAHARLSFYWVHLGPEVSFGVSGLAVGLGLGAHGAF